MTFYKCLSNKKFLLVASGKERIFDDMNNGFGLKKTSRIKAFVFKLISMPAKWIRTAKHYQQNIYTDNKLYQTPFGFTDG